MKNLATIFVLLAAASATVLAQIPNAGFETWTGGAPDNWATSNAAPVLVNVTQSATAHGGSASARGDVINIGGPVNIQPVLQIGPGGTGFAFSSRPASITGWYQFNSVGSDRFAVNVILFKGGLSGTAVANAAIADPTPYSSWHQFNVPFLYINGNTPDLCAIQFQIVSPTTGANPSVGSYFLLDDLGFSGTNSVGADGTTPHAFALHQNYPNPFNPSTVITYDVPATGNVRLGVYNLLGQEVATLVQDRVAAGSHQVAFNGAGFPSGTYLVRFQADGFVQTKSMVLLK